MISCVQANVFAGFAVSEAHACAINSAEVEPGQRADGGRVGAEVGTTGLGVRVGVRVVVGEGSDVFVGVTVGTNVMVELGAGMGVSVGAAVGICVSVGTEVGIDMLVGVEVDVGVPAWVLAAAKTGTM